jgi:hypothetical protein
MCFRLSVKLDAEQTAAGAAGKGKTPEKSRNFAPSIALSGAIVNLIWCANEGVQWQSVNSEMRFDGARRA